MVDVIQPNILGEFVGGQRAGLDIQQRRLGLQQARRQAPIRNALADVNLERARREEATALRTGGITEDSQRLQFLNRFGKAMKNIPLERRQEAATRLEPLALRVGIQPGVVTAPKRLTDESIQELIQSTEGFIRDPASLERQKLNLRERELKQRKELFFARPGVAGQTEKEKLEAQKALKAQVAAEVKTAEEQAKLSIKIVGQRFDSIAKINKNMLNIDRAIAALDAGARTGALQQFVPNITKASRELRQIQNELGLDVVGAVTFGALSKGELDLALGTALDLGQSEEALRDILVRKKDAQEKLVKFYGEAIRFLSRPGATVAQFMDRGTVQSPQGAPPTATTQAAPTATTQAAPTAAPQGVQFLGFE